MAVCCVPFCDSDSTARGKSNILFHKFPENPDVAAKWIRVIHTSVKAADTWFPRGELIICSKHFQDSDYKPGMKILLPKSCPSIFKHKPEVTIKQEVLPPKSKSSPLIVKVLRPVDKTAVVSDSNVSKQSDARARVDPFVETDSHAPIEEPFDIDSSTSSKKRKRNFVDFTAHCSNASPSKKTKADSKELFEIGPNTFLKINPEVIKVNKKQSTSGNTVLQFLMDKKMSKDKKNLPVIVKGDDLADNGIILPEATDLDEDSHVVGHLVDTHICKDNCDMKKIEKEMNLLLESDEEKDEIARQFDADLKKQFEDDIDEAPVLLTTDVPLSHTFKDKNKSIYQQVRVKTKQNQNLRSKVIALQQRVEELEDKIIVQERQLSYTFIKQLKQIRKCALKGDACAMYILEQIRCYEGHTKMRWSDTTLTQCAIWCRKAPYAYEYFKKANFFKLPSLGTVKRFMKKNPNHKFTNKTAIDDGESSSDFDYGDFSGLESGEEDIPEKEPTAGTSTAGNVESAVQEVAIVAQNSMEEENLPIEVEGELQEFILPSGEVVHCYRSASTDDTDGRSQYYIIPNAENGDEDASYSLIPADNYILQSESDIPGAPEQLILISDSGEQISSTIAVTTSD